MLEGETMIKLAKLTLKVCLFSLIVVIIFIILFFPYNFRFAFARFRFFFQSRWVIILLLCYYNICFFLNVGYCKIAHLWVLI